MDTEKTSNGGREGWGEGKMRRGKGKKVLNSKTTQRSDAILIIQINLEKKKLIYK